MFREVMAKERRAFHERRSAGVYKPIERHKLEGNLKEFVRSMIKRMRERQKETGGGGGGGPAGTPVAGGATPASRPLAHGHGSSSRLAPLHGVQGRDRDASPATVAPAAAAGAAAPGGMGVSTVGGSGALLPPAASTRTYRQSSLSPSPELVLPPPSGTPAPVVRPEQQQQEATPPAMLPVLQHLPLPVPGTPVEVAAGGGVVRVGVRTLADAAWPDEAPALQLPPQEQQQQPAGEERSAERGGGHGDGVAAAGDVEMAAAEDAIPAGQGVSGAAAVGTVGGGGAEPMDVARGQGAAAGLAAG